MHSQIAQGTLSESKEVMSHTPKHIESGAGWITNQFVSCIIYGFVIRIYCRWHWLLENSTVSLSVYFLDNPSSFPATAETLRTIPRLFCHPKQDLPFLYWIPPFLLWVSFLPAFQPPCLWTCSFFPWNLKSGLNIFAPADVLIGLSLLWFQTNWDVFNIQDSVVGCPYVWSHRFGFDFGNCLK